MSERLLAMIVNLIVGIYVARYLGPLRFGILSYATSFVGIFSVVATLGLDKIAVREFIDHPQNRETILGTLFVTKLFGALFVMGLIFLTLLITHNDTYTKLIILLIATGLLFQSFHAIDFYFQSQVTSKYAVFAHFFQITLSASAKTILVLRGADLVWFGVVILFDSITLAWGLVYFFCLQLKNKLKRWRFDSTLARRLLGESWPIALSGIVVTVYMKIDQIMIKEMLNAEAVGLYAVAVRLSEVWYFFPGVVMKSLFPAIIRLKNSNSTAYNTMLQQLHDMLFSVAFLIALFLFFFSRDIILFLFGENYLDAGRLLAVHVWAGIFVFPGNVRAHLVIIENKQLVALLFRTIGAVLNICLNFILIPRIGVIGAAWATLAAYIIPVCMVSVFDPLIRSTLVMTIKSYLLPIRLLNYKRPLYSTISHD